MGDDRNTAHGGFETGEQVERRSAPRAPISGLSVEGVTGAALAGRTLEAADLGVGSLFLLGADAAACESGELYVLRLHYDGKEADCETRCVRAERSPRVGAVLQITRAGEDARRLISAILQPSTVPFGG